jgi:lysophospholipase L1-like esterase
MKLPRGKRVGFALVAVAGSFMLLLGALFAADLYAHHRVERSAGLNRHGYRGPVVGRKPPGEVRVVMLGGSTVYGFDLEVEDALPAQLERAVRAVDPRVRVVNLGFNGEGAHTFAPTLRSYAYLDYDVVCLYEGYNDIVGDAGPNDVEKRHASSVFRAVGYFPILPLVLREKATFLKQGSAGDANAVFRPGLANRTSAGALEATSAIAEALERQLGRVVDPTDTATHSGSGCGAPWSYYCNAVAAGVRFAVERGTSVLVIGQPRLSYGQGERHASQQQALAEMIARDFADQPRVRYVDLADAVDLSNQSVAFDGLHLNREANAVVASRLVEPLRPLLPR